jgi:hypothetical protein
MNQALYAHMNNKRKRKKKKQSIIPCEKSKRACQQSNRMQNQHTKTNSFFYIPIANSLREKNQENNPIYDNLKKTTNQKQTGNNRKK